MDPMDYNKGILLGRITKVSGYEGAVTVKLEKTFSVKLPHMESVFLEIDGRPVPFFIGDYDYPGADILRLKFEGYNSPAKVTQFIGCRIFLTEGTIAEGNKGDMPDLEGFRVVTPDKKFEASVKEIIPNPGQWLINVATSEGREILIPLHEDLIVSIDVKNRLLVMDLPEGLIDLN